MLRFREAELVHGRWCMLAVTGMIFVEVLGYGNWMEAPTSVSISNPPEERKRDCKRGDSGSRNTTHPDGKKTQ